jgi:hypothetical protein
MYKPLSEYTVEDLGYELRPVAINGDDVIEDYVDLRLTEYYYQGVLC